MRNTDTIITWDSGEKLQYPSLHTQHYGTEVRVVSSGNMGGPI